MTNTNMFEVEKNGCLCNRSRRTMIVWGLSSLASCLCCATHAAGQQNDRWSKYEYSVQKLAKVPDLNAKQSHPDLVEVKRFLVRFGYIKAIVLSSQPTLLNANTVVALERFQNMNALPNTGVLDPATRARMLEQRCAMPDWADPLGALQVGGWKTKLLTYCFGQLSAQKDPQLLRDAVVKAFQTWASVPSLGLKFAETKEAAKSDILVKWVPANDPDRSLIGPLVAHADFPPGFSIVVTSGPLPLHFDDQETRWSINGQDMDMESIALHEIGHCLGMVHSNVPSAVMFPTVQEGKIKTQLDLNDITTIQTLYA